MEIFDYFIHCDDFIPAEYELTPEELYDILNSTEG